MADLRRAADTIILLVGAGHAHLFVASHAETLVSLGARVVLIEPAEFWYSGLASGMLGGMYEPVGQHRGKTAGEIPTSETLLGHS